MNLKTRIATFATAAILAVSASTGVLAETQSTVTQEIGTNENGVLNAYIEDGALTRKPFSFQSQTSTGTLNLHVEDSRGSGAGWNVRVQSTEFRNGNNSIPADNFRHKGIGSIVTHHGDANGIISESQDQSFQNPVKVLKADSPRGTGEFTVPMNVELAIPGAQPAGTYTATFTVAINNGPS